MDAMKMKNEKKNLKNKPCLEKHFNIWELNQSMTSIF